jgi:hypothetical protein
MDSSDVGRTLQLLHGSHCHIMYRLCIGSITHANNSLWCSELGCTLGVDGCDRKLIEQFHVLLHACCCVLT